MSFTTHIIFVVCIISLEYIGPTMRRHIGIISTEYVFEQLREKRESHKTESQTKYIN